MNTSLHPAIQAALQGIIAVVIVGLPLVLLKWRDKRRDQQSRTRPPFIDSSAPPTLHTTNSPRGQSGCLYHVIFTLSCLGWTAIVIAFAFAITAAVLGATDGDPSMWQGFFIVSLIPAATGILLLIFASRAGKRFRSYRQ